MRIAVDFDGTLCEHRFPDIGNEAVGAFAVLRRVKACGHTVMLWTMRSDGQEHGPVLTQAVEWCRAHDFEFDHVNSNDAGQAAWTSSPKLYANIYIDDAALGCPLREPRRAGGRKVVDWSRVEELLEEKGVFKKEDKR